MKQRVSVLVAVALSIVACSDSTDPGDAVAGTYTLTLFAGSPLPATLVEGDFSYTVNSGSVTINPGNTFSNTIDAVIDSGGVVEAISGTCTGTFTRKGNVLTFVTKASGSGNTECEAGTTLALWNGSDMITMGAAGQQFVYSRLDAAVR